MSKQEFDLSKTIAQLEAAIYEDSSNPKDLIGDTKPSLALIPPTALIEESLAMADGANKYGAYNFRGKKIRSMVYINAALRHLLTYLDGEERTRDSNVHHLASVRACCGILLDAQANDSLIDDRPSAGKAGDLIDKYTKKRETTNVYTKPFDEFG